MRRYALGLTALALGATPAFAQSARIACWAPHRGGESLMVPGFIGNLTGLAAMERMRDSVVGQYRFVEVATEGAGRTRHLIESRVVFTGSSPIDTTRRVGYARDVIADGVAQVLRSGDPAGRLRPPADTGRYRLTIHYSPPDRLTIMHFDPRFANALINDDPRPIYEVVEIDSAGTISGRWAGGGIAGLVVDTPAGRFGEMPSGYFCAFRERPRRSP